MLADIAGTLWIEMWKFLKRRSAIHAARDTPYKCQLLHQVFALTVIRVHLHQLPEQKIPAHTHKCNFRSMPGEYSGGDTVVIVDKNLNHFHRG